MAETKTFTEEIQITADKLIETIKELLHEGNVRHIVIKNAEGHTVLEIPVTIGVVGILLAPIIAAVGALVVYAGHFNIVVTREGTPPTTPPSSDGAGI